MEGYQVAAMTPFLLVLFPLIVWPFWKLINYHLVRHTVHDQDPEMSADTVSSLFPDRPIRPLPKRRLRERLSPEVAGSIQYPPAPQTLAPLFSYPYSLRDDEQDGAFVLSRERAAALESRQSRRSALGLESEEDDSTIRRSIGSRPITDSSDRLAHLSPRLDHGRITASQLPLSSTSSVDGYDSFENTNNKKKRKIPTAGDAALNGVHLINDVGSGNSHATAVQSIEGHGENAASSSATHGSGGFASGTQNVAGPGRGRYGRPRSGRSPLRPLSDSTNNWAGRNGKLRSGQWVSNSSTSSSAYAWLTLFYALHAASTTLIMNHL